MDFEWSYVIDVALLSLYLGIATYLKRNVTFLRKYLVPNSQSQALSAYCWELISWV